MLILIDNTGRVLLERRPTTGIWGGLWSLPADDDNQPLQQRLGLNDDDLQPLPSMQHQLTHMLMTIRPYIVHTRPVSGGVECVPGQAWFGPKEWPTLGLPKPVRQLLELHLENSGK